MDDRLAVTLLEVISNKPNCESALSTVCSELLRRRTLGQLDTSELRRRLQNLQNTFSISEGPHEIQYVRIEVKTPLCPMRTQCSNSACEGLHICKFFLLSNSCTRRMCDFGHNLDNLHNRKVLSQHWMDQLHVEGVRNIFRCIRNRTFETTPQICRNFQNGRCDKSQKICSRVHLCPYYINESCTKGPDCVGHDVFDEGVAFTLERYGIDMKRSVKDILGDLRAFELCRPTLSRYRSDPQLPRINQERNIRGRNIRGRGRLGGPWGSRGNFGRIPQENLMQPLCGRGRLEGRGGGIGNFGRIPQENLMQPLCGRGRLEGPGGGRGNLGRIPQESLMQPLCGRGRLEGPGGGIGNLGRIPQENLMQPLCGRGRLDGPGGGRGNLGRIPQENLMQPLCGRGQLEGRGGGSGNLGRIPQENLMQPLCGRGRLEGRGGGIGNFGRIPQENPMQPLCGRGRLEGPGGGRGNLGRIPQESLMQPLWPGCPPQQPCLDYAAGPPPHVQYQSHMVPYQDPKKSISQGKPQPLKVPHRQPKQPKEKYTDEICMKNFRKCRQKGKCDKHHKKGIYQWQYQLQTEDGSEKQAWHDFDDSTNNQLEKTFADPQESQYLLPYRRGDIVTVDLQAMTGCSRQTHMTVRRLTTPSSDSPQIEPERYRWSTLWRWFLEDELGAWIEYGGMECDIRHKLEQAFIDNPVGKLQLQINDIIYDIHFDSMTHTNVSTSTKRRIRRRPHFFTTTEIETRIDPRLLKPLCPKEWSTVYTDMDQLVKHYKIEMVSETSEEYQRVHSLFKKTLPQGKMIIERIENGELWIRFDAQKELMKRKAGKVDERQLFHGTSNSTTKAICKQGFEFRYSGDRYGSRHGRGSYFARDAKYSHCYTDQNTVIRKMFVAQVLVGEFTRGTRDDKRPPPKSASAPHELFDSCVDDEKDPQIFVIFSLDQAYPRYLITYIDLNVCQ